MAEYAKNTQSHRDDTPVRLAVHSRYRLFECHIPLLAAANVPSVITPGDGSGSPFPMARQQPWSPPMTVRVPAGSPAPS